MTNQHEGHVVRVQYPAVWSTSIEIDGNTVVMESDWVSSEIVDDSGPTFICQDCDDRRVHPYELGLTGGWDMGWDK
jgi:hypothetical protein